MLCCLNGCCLMNAHSWKCSSSLYSLMNMQEYGEILVGSPQTLYIANSPVMSHGDEIKIFSSQVNIMKTSLILFGVIFLVIGGVFYFMPSQTAQATTTTVGPTTDTRTSYATIQIPPSVTYATLLIGLALLALGFILPGPAVRPQVEVRRTSTHSAMKMKEQTVDDDGNKRTVIRREEREE